MFAPNAVRIAELREQAAHFAHRAQWSFSPRDERWLNERARQLMAEADALNLADIEAAAARQEETR